MVIVKKEKNDQRLLSQISEKIHLLILRNILKNTHLFYDLY